MDSQEPLLVREPRLLPSVQNKVQTVKYAAVLLAMGLVGSIVYVNNLSTVTVTNGEVSSSSEGELHVMNLKKSSKGSSNKNPNIVFILADDMGYNSLSSDVTPFMHGLQNKGVVLESYYSQESCTPARASLLTGRYPLSIGLQFYEQEISNLGGLPDDETTIAEVLQDEGYTTYMVGKWNLGNAEASQLPTARGFDYYLGFLDAYNHYWSKRNPDYADYVDFMYADSTCYYMYDGDDLETYSTTIFQNAAVAAIEGHDFDDSSMFMYVALQAARAPFEDSKNKNGLEDSDLDSVGASDASTYISKKIDGDIQKQYFMSIAVADQAAEGIYKALDDRDVLDNSYIIFASDNGGCPTAGGRNYPLRGTKGSLFEGGVKVESFIYSPMFSSKLQGSSYSNVFHVSDWFPTILDMAGVKYSPKSKYALDGVSHLDAITDGKDAPREYMLYNYYYDPSSSKEDLWSGKAMAIRNDRYKLMHTYQSPTAAQWYDGTTQMQFDDDLGNYDGCAQFTAVMSGSFTYYLFDLKEDPNEEKNLYDSSDKYKEIQEDLYDALDDAANNAAKYCESSYESSATKTWSKYDNYVVPWADRRRRLGDGRKLSSKLSNCGLWSDSFKSEVEVVNTPVMESSLMRSSRNVVKTSPFQGKNGIGKKAVQRSSATSAKGATKEGESEKSEKSEKKSSPKNTDVKKSKNQDSDSDKSASKKSSLKSSSKRSKSA